VDAQDVVAKLDGVEAANTGEVDAGEVVVGKLMKRCRIDKVETKPTSKWREHFVMSFHLRARDHQACL
jgi:hypothetical protein